MADEKAGTLADLISGLWRQGQRAATRQTAPDTAQAALEETLHPLATRLQQLCQAQIVRRDRRSPGTSSTDQGMQE